MSESTEEPRYIICSPTQYGATLVEAVEMTCCKCNEAVWVSLAAAPRALHDGYAPLCTDCWVPMHLSGQGHTHAIPEEIRAELRRFGIEEFAEKFTALLNRDSQTRKRRMN